MADLVVALDVSDGDAALRLADALRDEVRWLKVGPVLFVAEGPALVRELVSRSLFEPGVLHRDPVLEPLWGTAAFRELIRPRG